MKAKEDRLCKNALWNAMDYKHEEMQSSLLVFD